jgi:hypothetical protein
VNYIQVLEKVDFPCMVTLTASPFKGNQLKAETGKIAHCWLLVVVGAGSRDRARRGVLLRLPREVLLAPDLGKIPS